MRLVSLVLRVNIDNAFFVIAPGVSFWLERDIGYGWSLFWLAMPAMFVTLSPCGVRTAVVLLGENMLAC